MTVGTTSDDDASAVPHTPSNSQPPRPKRAKHTHNSVESEMIKCIQEIKENGLHLVDKIQKRTILANMLLKF